MVTTRSALIADLLEPFPLYQPLGFMAHFKSRDYDEPRPRSTLSPQFKPLNNYGSANSCGPIRMALDQGQIAVINDNKENYEFIESIQ